MGYKNYQSINQLVFKSALKQSFQRGLIRVGTFETACLRMIKQDKKTRKNDTKT